jgi:hypothetical protein
MIRANAHGFGATRTLTVTFVDLTASTDETLQANLIMPGPCPFLNQEKVPDLLDYSSDRD